MPYAMKCINYKFLQKKELYKTYFMNEVSSQYFNIEI